MNYKDMDIYEVLKCAATTRDEEGFYNTVRQFTLIEFVNQMRREDPRFDALYRTEPGRGLFYAGSRFDKLKVGNRWEVDINIVLKMPEVHRITEIDPNLPHFMKIKPVSVDQQIKPLLAPSGHIDPVKVFEVLQRAANLALAKLGGRWKTQNGVNVRLDHEVKNPYVLRLMPQSEQFPDLISIDLVAAFEISIDKLPAATRDRIRSIQEQHNVKQARCLAVALPVVSKQYFQIDFPGIARELMKNKPSLKGSIRILKFERNLFREPYDKIFSYCYKNLGLLEVLDKPDDDLWKIECLWERYCEMRERLANHLIFNHMPDAFIPALNLMKRVKDLHVKESLGGYLRKKRFCTRRPSRQWQRKHPDQIFKMDDDVESHHYY